MLVAWQATYWAAGVQLDPFTCMLDIRSVQYSPLMLTLVTILVKTCSFAQLNADQLQPVR